jgi:hypothetical protein
MKSKKLISGYSYFPSRVKVQGTSLSFGSGKMGPLSLVIVNFQLFFLNWPVLKFSLVSFVGFSVSSVQTMGSHKFHLTVATEGAQDVH